MKVKLVILLLLILASTVHAVNRDSNIVQWTAYNNSGELAKDFAGQINDFEGSFGGAKKMAIDSAKAVIEPKTQYVIVIRFRNRTFVKRVRGD